MKSNFVKILYNFNIITTQIFLNTKFDLKGHWRSQKATLLLKGFCALSYEIVWPYEKSDLRSYGQRLYLFGIGTTMLYEMSLNARKDFNLIYYLLYRYFYYIIINGIKLYGIILMHFIKKTLSFVHYVYLIWKCYI